MISIVLKGLGVTVIGILSLFMLHTDDPWSPRSVETRLQQNEQRSAQIILDLLDYHLDGLQKLTAVGIGSIDFTNKHGEDVRIHKYRHTLVITSLETGEHKKYAVGLETLSFTFTKEGSLLMRLSARVGRQRSSGGEYSYIAEAQKVIMDSRGELRLDL